MSVGMETICEMREILFMDNGIKEEEVVQFSCIIENKTQWMDFPHLYYPSNPVFARAFVEKAGRYAFLKQYNCDFDSHML